MGMFDKAAPAAAAPVEKGPTGREAQRLLAAEQLSAFRHVANTTTEFMERLAGQSVNAVLEVFSGVFDASGQISRDYNVAAGAIEVSAWGVPANFVTVSTASAGGSAPTGTGTYIIAGGATRTVALASRAFTLYGVAGDRVSFQVFTAAVRPVAG